MRTGGDHLGDSVLAQTDRILASPHFSRSATLTRLLRFLIEVTLDGKQDELKEYRLGVDVFGRGDDFDPRVDPIVRMQASKLRSRLAEYYSAEGQSDPVLISIPKGGYIPSFKRLEGRDGGAPAAGSPDIQSIAVLPFVNMSADPENEYFSDGLTEELINILTSVPGLRVVARTSVFSFKNAAMDVREIGKRLNVQTVLEGSVRKAGNQLRVTAQLIDVSSGYHLLSRAYPRELKDIFAVQEELANAVVSEIMPQVRGERQDSVIRVQPANLDAYSLYLRGMFTLSKGVQGPQESVEIFQQVLQTDPNYAPAAAGMAYAHAIMAWYGVVPVAEGMSLGKAAALRALNIDAGLALGHTVLGLIQATFEWKWEEAERSFERAVALQPSLALAYQLHASRCLLVRRRITEAVSMIERALSLNPFDTMLLASATHIYASAGNYHAAQHSFALGVEVNPEYPLLYRAMGLAHQARGHFREAIAAFGTACEVSRRSPVALAALGNALAASGDRQAAEALLDEIRSAPGTNALPMAVLHIGLDQQDESMRWLEKAIDEREPVVTLLPVDPRFSSMAGNARFEELLGRMGLSVGQKTLQIGLRS